MATPSHSDLERRKIPSWRNAIEVAWNDAISVQRSTALTDGSIAENEALAGLLGAGFEHLAETHAARKVTDFPLRVLEDLSSNRKISTHLSSTVREASQTVTRTIGLRRLITVGFKCDQKEDDPERFLSDRESIAVRYGRLIGERWIRGAIQITMGSRCENLAVVTMLGGGRYGYLAEVAFKRHFESLSPSFVSSIASAADAVAPASTAGATIGRAAIAVAVLADAFASFSAGSYRDVAIGPFSEWR